MRMASLPRLQGFNNLGIDVSRGHLKEPNPSSLRVPDFDFHEPRWGVGHFNQRVHHSVV